MGLMTRRRQDLPLMVASFEIGVLSEAAALALEDVQRFLNGPPRTVIVVPPRIVNVVA